MQGNSHSPISQLTFSYRVTFAQASPSQFLTIEKMPRAFSQLCKLMLSRYLT